MVCNANIFGSRKAGFTERGGTWTSHFFVVVFERALWGQVTQGVFLGFWALVDLCLRRWAVCPPGMAAGVEAWVVLGCTHIDVRSIIAAELELGLWCDPGQCFIELVLQRLDRLHVQHQISQLGERYVFGILTSEYCFLS